MTLTKRVISFGLVAVFVRTFAIATSETKGPRTMQSAEEGTLRWQARGSIIAEAFQWIKYFTTAIFHLYQQITCNRTRLKLITGNLLKLNWVSRELEQKVGIKVKYWLPFKNNKLKLTDHIPVESNLAKDCIWLQVTIVYN